MRDSESHCCKLERGAEGLCTASCDPQQRGPAEARGPTNLGPCHFARARGPRSSGHTVWLVFVLTLPDVRPLALEQPGEVSRCLRELAGAWCEPNGRGAASGAHSGLGNEWRW